MYIGRGTISVSPAGRPVSCQGFVALSRTWASDHNRPRTTFFTGSGCGEFYLRLLLGSDITGLTSIMIFTASAEANNVMPHAVFAVFPGEFPTRSVLEVWIKSWMADMNTAGFGCFTRGEVHIQHH